MSTTIAPISGDGSLPSAQPQRPPMHEGGAAGRQRAAAGVGVEGREHLVPLDQARVHLVERAPGC